MEMDDDVGNDQFIIAGTTCFMEMIERKLKIDDHCNHERWTNEKSSMIKVDTLYLN